MKLILYSKPNCHLCEGLEEKLNAITDIALEIEIRDINTNLFSLKANQTLWYSELTYSKKIKKHNYVVGINCNRILILLVK